MEIYTYLVVLLTGDPTYSAKPTQAQIAECKCRCEDYARGCDPRPRMSKIVLFSAPLRPFADYTAHAEKVRTRYPSFVSFRKGATIGECWRSLAAAWGGIPSNKGTLRHDSISENGWSSNLESSHVLGHAQSRDTQPEYNLRIVLLLPSLSLVSVLTMF
ncbi:hypothetical protein M441DRAFT_238811 [Trichoderma asperellum CBS 433.97]|uniref:Uncharacterized protein n=1 Tax=Trichoderma asperellum (strain ATCC 204424 / CBS 433.97 / NBRC 101777) TaxID=1042311 RepID=A0A2T3Z1W7_TRIA4|nr:hypothetical protein M441DRAFT_238811 [Trichoderma asperellum CBS 433.97]PTB38787.1 hypothetical protein M441DRAFT_238811 [Trichoderma asperellum CBS 433.97]